MVSYHFWAGNDRKIFSSLSLSKGLSKTKALLELSNSLRSDWLAQAVKMMYLGSTRLISVFYLVSS